MNRRCTFGRILVAWLAATGCGSNAPVDAGIDGAPALDVRVDHAVTDAPDVADVPGAFDVQDVTVAPDAGPDVVDTGPLHGSPGCGSTPPRTGYTATVHITSGGADRTYALSIPTAYDPTHPYTLVFAFHGDGGTGSGLRGSFGLEPPANGQAIFVYPDATVASGRSFDIETPYATNADMHLFTDLVASLSAAYCIDPHRVFAAGMSRGAFFCNFLNCRLGTTYLRAIAPHSGSGPYGPNSDYDADGHFICQNPAAGAMLIHGEADTVVPLSDDTYTRQQWEFENHCSASTTPYAPSPCVAHTGCDADKPLVWCQIPGMGHSIWPQAGVAIWGFFQSFP